MSNVLKFDRGQDETGADLETISGDMGLNVFFPGTSPELTLAVQTKISQLNDTIKSKTHQLAVWHALCQLDNMRKNTFAGAEGVAGLFGDEHQVEVQIGIFTPS